MQSPSGKSHIGQNGSLASKGGLLISFGFFELSGYWFLHPLHKTCQIVPHMLEVHRGGPLIWPMQGLGGLCAVNRDLPAKVQALLCVPLRLICNVQCLLRQRGPAPGKVDFSSMLCGTASERSSCNPSSLVLHMTQQLSDLADHSGISDTIRT